MWFIASSYNFVHPLFSLKSSSSCLHLLPSLSAPSILPYTFPAVTWFRWPFLRNKWPIKLVFLLLLDIGYSFPTWLYVVLHFSHDRSSWSPSISSTTFQKFSGISDLLSAVPKFQSHSKPSSECRFLLISSLNLSPICWWKESSCYRVWQRNVTGTWCIWMRTETRRVTIRYWLGSAIYCFLRIMVCIQ